MKKIFAIAVIFLVFLQISSAKTMLNHDMIIDVSRQGTAEIIERFVFGLEGSEIFEFDEISRTLTNDVSIWNDFDIRIKTYAKDNTSIVKISSTKISQGQFGYEIKLEYEVDEFAKVIETQGRYSIYEINGDSFLFNEESVFSIPKNTDLTISLDSTVAEEDIIEIIPTPWTTINEQSFKWVSGTHTNLFYLKYQVETGISESFSLQSFINFFIEKQVYGAALIIMALLATAYRKQISELISESFTGEENIEMPRRKIK